MPSQPSQTSQPSIGAARKRKEPEPTALEPAAPAPETSNRLLAGYLANEFLTKGTLLGRRFELAKTMKPPKPMARPVAARGGAAAAAEKEPAKQQQEDEAGRGGYADVAQLMRASGVHIPEVVNPTQLDQWLRR